VFASDVYSVGVTMYQMLTGALPYEAPAPADLDRLMRGTLVTPPRLKNKAIPKVINDIVLRALSPDLTVRYARAGDLLQDILATRDDLAARPRDVDDIQARVKARAAPQAKFCWHCSKPLQARTEQCPFCGETQSR
jgi:serine/threonine protein kinase